MTALFNPNLKGPLVLGSGEYQSKLAFHKRKAFSTATKSFWYHYETKAIHQAGSQATSQPSIDPTEPEKYY